MKVLQLHAGYRTPAGEDTVVAAEAATLERAGHEVRQVNTHNPHGVGESISALVKSRYNRNAAARAAQACTEFQPDVAHIHNTWFTQSSSVIDAVADAGVASVMTIHNYRLGCLSADLFRGNDTCTSCVGRSPIKGVFHGCYRGSRPLSAVMAVEVMSTRRRSTLDRIDRFVAPSAFMADRLIDIGLPSQRLCVKPHFTPDPGPRSNAPSESDNVLFIGRLASAKGIRTLLRAWERSTHRSAADVSDGPLRLTIIGDGPLAAEARESAPRGVEFTGWLPHAEVQQRMLASRAFVFPSEWYEPFGMVLIEAMAAGLPVVTTNASDAVRITGTPSALVAPSGDDRALSGCIDRLSDDTVDEVGRQGRDRFESMYSEAVGVDALVSLYRSVIESAQAAP
ncbi:MAG: glycosyltransferase family 4 protein [Ilumatobacter sp.]